MNSQVTSNYYETRALLQLFTIVLHTLKRSAILDRAAIINTAYMNQRYSLCKDKISQSSFLISGCVGFIGANLVELLLGLGSK